MRATFRHLLLALFLLPLTAFAQPHVEWASYVIDYSSQKADKEYSSEQALGKPNKCPASGDSPCAWLPITDDGVTEEWIHVGFEKPMRIQQVAIAQNFYPGAIEKVMLFDEKGHQRSEYDYTPASEGPYAKIKHITFAPTWYAVASVKIVLQPGLVPGQNEIDAIAISDAAQPVEAEINVVPDLNVGEREHLGPAINSAYEEVLPVISPDGKTLYVVRKNHPDNIGQGDNIWYSTQDARGNWTTLKNIGPPLNNGLGSFVTSVTPDGNTLLLGGSFHTGNTPEHFGLWMTHRTTDGWSYPEQVQLKDYYTKAKFVEFCLSNDGRTIVLALERNDTHGNKDLYVSFREADGTWSAPKNLGAAVNSAADEATPFLAADGRTLYYASDGFAGYGSMDVFITRRLDDTWQHWSEPENLGPSLNTSGWDGYYTIPASGEYAYYVSTENSYGLGDIFRVKLPPSLRPKPVLLISGKVIDAKTKKPLDATIKYEILSNGKEIGSASTDPTTGIYKITLPSGENYGYRAEAPGYIPISENLDLTKIEQYQELERNLTLVPLEAGQTVRLNNIFFETAKAELRPESFAELDRIVKLLKDHPTMEIAIGGHTDTVGSPALNKQLSESRAAAVEQYLISKGIAAKRLKAKGYGETKPIAPNSTEEGRQQNRRVEFTIVKQ